MVDEIYDRAYQSSRNELHLAIAQAIGRSSGAVRNAFAVLNRIEYAAPWAHKQRKAKRA